MTRLPTTVDQTSCTRDPDENPEAVRSTLEFTGPLVDASSALTLLLAARPLVCSVVRAFSVGTTLTGQSMEAGGGPSSFVTVKLTVAPFVYGIGDCGTFKYK